MVKEALYDTDEDWTLYVKCPIPRTTYIQEVPIYTMDKLLSEVGGYLGLFVGMSILSLIEILVYIGTSIKERYYGL